MSVSKGAARPWVAFTLFLLTMPMIFSSIPPAVRAGEPSSGPPSGAGGGEDIGDLFLRALFQGMPNAAKQAEQQAQDARTQRAWEQLLIDEEQIQERVMNPYQGWAPEGTPFDWADRYSYGLSGGVNQAVNDFLDAMFAFETNFSQILAGAAGITNVLEGYDETKATAQKIDLAAAVVQLTVGLGKLGYGGYQWWRAGRAGAEALGAADDAVRVADEVVTAADDAGKTVTLPGAVTQGEDAIDTVRLPGQAEDAIDTVRLPGQAEDAVGTVITPGQAGGAAARAEDGIDTVTDGQRVAQEGFGVGPVAGGTPPTGAPTTAAELLKDDPHIAEWAARAGVNVDEIIESVYGGMRGHNPAKDEQALERVIMAIVERYGYHRLSKNLQDALEYALSNLEIAIGQGRNTANIGSDLATIRQVADQFSSIEDFITYVSKAYDIHGFDTGVELVFTPERLALLRQLLEHGDDVNAIRQAMGPVRTAGLAEATAGLEAGVSYGRVAEGTQAGLNAGQLVGEAATAGGQTPMTPPAVGTTPPPALLDRFEQVRQDAAGLDQAGGLDRILGDFGVIGRLRRKGYWGTVVGDAVNLLLSPGETSTDYFYTFGMLDAYDQLMENYGTNIDRMSTAYDNAVRALEHLDMVLESFQLNNPESVLGGKGAADLQGLLDRMREIYNGASADWQCEHRQQFTERWNHIRQKKRDIENAVTQLRAFMERLPAIRQSLEGFGKDGRSGLELFQPALYMRILSIGVLLDAHRSVALGMGYSPLLKVLTDNPQVAGAAQGNPQVSVNDSPEGFLAQPQVPDTLFVDDDRGLLWGPDNDMFYIPCPGNCPLFDNPLFVASESPIWCTYGTGEPLPFLVYSSPTELLPGENDAPGPATLPGPEDVSPPSPDGPQATTPGTAPPAGGPQTQTPTGPSPPTEGGPPADSPSGLTPNPNYRPRANAGTESSGSPREFGGGVIVPTPALVTGGPSGQPVVPSIAPGPTPGDTSTPRDDSTNEPGGGPNIIIPTVTIRAKTTTQAMSQGESVAPTVGYTLKLLAPTTIDPLLPGPGVAQTQADHDRDPISAVTDDKGQALLTVPPSLLFPSRPDSPDSVSIHRAPQGYMMAGAMGYPYHGGEDDLGEAQTDTPGLGPGPTEPVLDLYLFLPVGPTHSQNVEIPRGTSNQLPSGLQDFVTDQLPVGDSTFVTVTCGDGHLDFVNDLIAGLPNVISLQENFCDAKRNPPTDPYYLKRGSNTEKGSWGQNYDDQWAVKHVGLTSDNKDLWKKVQAGQPVVVAVIDSGLDWHHADIDWRNLWRNPGEIPDNGEDDDGNGYIDDIIGWDFYGRNNKPWDHDGHGTLITGIIAAAHNEIGIAGINPHVRIMVLKGLNNFGHSRASYLSKALVYAADNGAQVVNMSVGGGYTSIMEQRAVDYALRKGVIIVVASGNEGSSTEGDGTASHPGVITVASTDWNDKRVAFSNWGPAIDLAAPGMDILSLRARRTDTMLHIEDVDYEAGTNYVGPDKRYYRASGTSFSAPIVTGAASLLLSARPELKPEQVRRMLLQNAKDIETPGVDQLTGYGLLDIPAALAADPEFSIDVQITGVEVAQQNRKMFVNVRGTADADRFRAAAIYIGAGENPSEWKKVVTIRRAVRDGLLGSIPASEFGSAKVWMLRLVTEHRSRKEREFRFRLATG